MYTKTTYVYEKDGIIGYACGYKPEDVTILEERPILYSEVGFELERISDGERMSAVWLKDGDTKENYREVEIEPEPELNGGSDD